MGLLTSILNSSSTLQVLNEQLSTIQENITNANTPGYADQTLAVKTLPFDPAEGLTGGILPGNLVSSRDQYLEQNVRTQQGQLGFAQQEATDLGQVQTSFDPTSTTGVASSISTFFQSFSQLSVNPNDEVSRQNVLTAAGQVAEAFNQNAAGLTQASQNAVTQTTDVAANINQIASQLAQINSQYDENSASTQDAGLGAQANALLEQLSQLTNFTVIGGNQGTNTVYIGGQTPLVIGNQSFAISTNNNSGATQILDSQGVDITSSITQGSLGALIQENNTTLPSYSSQLNTLAQTFADQVNTALDAGVDENGDPPATDLFTYDPTNAAASLSASSITPDQIAAASASAPGGNGNALALAQLENSPVLNGFTLTQGYGNLSSQVGEDVANAQQDQTEAQDQVTQAQTLRQNVSGVDINQEAAKLLQIQQQYDATGKFINVLDEMTETLIESLEPTT